MCFNNLNLSIFNVKQELRKIKGNADQISKRLEFLEAVGASSFEFSQVFGLLTEIKKSQDFIRGSLKEIADSAV